MREPDRQSLSRRRRAKRFKAHHFARDVFTENVIFYELINRELLDYPARNAECFYASKRPVGIARIKEKLSRHNSRGTHAFLRPKEGEPFVLDAVEKRRKSLPPIFSGETVNLGRDLH